MMRARLLSCLLVLSIATAGSRGLAQAQSPPEKKNADAFDACTLIEKKEIESVQGSEIRETKSSQRADGDFRVSQCFYTAAEFSHSVTLAVFQRNPTGPSDRDPLEFWDRTFGRYRESKKGESNEEKEAEAKKSREEEEEGVPPRNITGLGDEAFWVPNRFGGILYVLKAGQFLSLSIGGSDKEEVKLDKSKKLAAKALGRFK